MWLLVVIVILLDGYVPSGSLDILKVVNTITAIISTLVLGSQGWMRLDMCPVVLVMTCGWAAVLPQTSLSSPICTSTSSHSRLLARS